MIASQSPQRDEEIVASDLAYIHKGLGAEFPALANKRLLITGGAGFLGYYLTQTVLEWNESVTYEQSISLTVLDNFPRGLPRWLRARQNSPNLRILPHDVSRPLPAELGDIDYIIHAASIASPTFYRLHPIETMDANVVGLRSLLDYAVQQRDQGKKLLGFLYFSTSEIYGDPTPEHIPTPETYRGNVSCTGPRACYDESKRYGETLCVNFAQQYALPISVARPFNNYGPGLRLDDRRVLSDFVRDVLSGRDIAILSDGSPSRTFCYVADAVIGYYKVLLRGRPGEAYNIGTEYPEVSILVLAESVAALARELLGYSGRVVRGESGDREYLVDNPVRRCPTIAKARTELGFEPKISLEEGLRRAIVWYAALEKRDEWA